MKYTGLTAEEVAERRRAGQTNEPVAPASKSLKEIIASNVFTYFNFVFFVIAVILVLVGSARDLTFMFVVVANTLTGIFQEVRAKQILDKLTVLNAPKARVLREGELTEIAVEELVLGDIVKFKAGDQIPADAEVVEGEMAVNEALLTGEADEIVKKAGAELMSGSFVVSGEGLARLTRVGSDSYVAKLTLQAKAIKGGEQSEMLRSLNKIVTIMGVVIIPVGLAMVVEQLAQGLTVRESVLAAVAAVIGMIPEGLYLLATATLTISAIRLAQNEVLVHDMKCIETLARVDTLCVDKTGTITEGEMEVYTVSEVAKGGEGILRDFIGVQKADNATMSALKKWCGRKSKVEAKKVYGFSSRYKYSAVEFGAKKYVLGAPEIVLSGNEEIWGKIEEYSGKGYRVLVFGEYNGKLGEVLERAVEAEAIIVLKNRIRKTAAETFRYFREQGVEVKVISGDSPLTVSEVARQVGIEGAEKYVDMTEVEVRKIGEVAKKYTVFGRVTPEQKRKLIKALQEAGRTVAMTGDGVNDVLALKDADCSVAMASGAEAAVQAAQLVLLQSDFSKMPDVVREGRRVVNNLERSGSLFLVKNMFSLTMAIFAVLFAFRYPLTPNQVSLVTAWTIGVPSFFLAQLPNEKLIRGKFIENVMQPAFFGALADVISVLVVMTLGKMMGLSATQIGMGCALAMAVVGIVYMWRISRPLDKWKKLIIAGCVIGILFCILVIPGMWDFVW